jgi:hypothetical protein
MTQVRDPGGDHPVSHVRIKLPRPPQQQPPELRPVIDLRRTTAPRSALYCTVTPMDCHGRLADRSPLRAVGWPAGQPVTITASPEGQLVTVRAGGPNAITRDGHLRLPAHIQRGCHLTAGDRLLVTAATAPARLAVYPMATIEKIISQQPSAMAAPATETT